MDIDVLTRALTSFVSLPPSDDMEDDELSVPDSPLESGEMSPRQAATVDKQRANLQTYLDALPYQCESVEEMEVQLENIVGKIAVCVKSNNWLSLTTWDGALQWYVTCCGACERGLMNI